MKTLALALLLPCASWAAFLPSTFTAEYEESFISAATGKEKKSRGRIDYQYPRHIRFQVLSPDPSTFVANPRMSWYYTPPFIEGEEGQVVEQKSDDLPLAKFLDALKHGTESNAAYAVSHEGKKLVLSFTPKTRKELGMDRAELEGAGEALKATGLGDFKELRLQHADGKKVTLRFLSFKAGVGFPAGHFEFKAPPKTRVSKGK